MLRVLVACVHLASIALIVYVCLPHTDNDEQDIVYENGKPIFAILRLLGVLPITRTAPGVTVFKMGSASMAYSLFIFVLVVVSGWDAWQINIAFAVLIELIRHYLFPPILTLSHFVILPRPALCVLCGVESPEDNPESGGPLRGGYHRLLVPCEPRAGYNNPDDVVRGEKSGPAAEPLE